MIFTDRWVQQANACADLVCGSYAIDDSISWARFVVATLYDLAPGGYAALAVWLGPHWHDGQRRFGPTWALFRAREEGRYWCEQRLEILKATSPFDQQRLVKYSEQQARSLERSGKINGPLVPLLNALGITERDFLDGHESLELGLHPPRVLGGGALKGGEL